MYSCKLNLDLMLICPTVANRFDDDLSDSVRLLHSSALGNYHPKRRLIFVNDCQSRDNINFLPKSFADKLLDRNWP